jgi:hypothetical protein
VYRAFLIGTPALFDLGFLVQRMLVIPFAVLHQLKLFLRGLPVFRRSIVAALALGTGKGDNLYGLFLSSHDTILLKSLAR